MNIDEGYCRWALYHPPLWRCHSTDAKQAKSDRGAPYIYWRYSRWAVGLSIHHCGVLSQHGSKAGSNGRSVNCSSCVHAWPESSGTAAEDCRREGCIRHRLTLAHQDRPKPHASRARLPEGVGLLWANPRGKSYDNSHQGHRGWALSSTFVALSQHGSKAGSNDRSVNGNNFCAHMARAVEQRPRIAAARGVSDTVSHPTRFFSRPSPPPPPSPPPRPPPPHVCSLVTSLSSCSSSSSSSASFSCSSSCFLVVALMLLLSLQWKALRRQGAAFLAALYCSSSSFASCSCMFAGGALACTSAMFVLLRGGLLMSRSKAGSCGRSGVEREGRSYIQQRLI